jgi:hypothetical protein
MTVEVFVSVMYSVAVVVLLQENLVGFTIYPGQDKRRVLNGC